MYWWRKGCCSWVARPFSCIRYGWPCSFIKPSQEHFWYYGTALAWISSYLKDRSFRVSVGDATSSNQDLRYGVPQSSVVGPLFFVLYTCCIGTIIRKYNIHYHMYADDVQLYLPFNAKSEHDIRFAIDKLSSCINEISEWMTMNKLKLNDEKTEFFLASSQHNLHHLKDICINICGSIISQSVTIRNLGVIFDQTMSMSEHVKHTAASVNCHLRNIYRILRYITIDSCHKLVRSLVLSRLDYANSMLYGIASKDRKKLQSLQNRAARVVFRSDRRHPSAPLLSDLHWLPLESRIVFKLLLLTYKGINGLLPSYLAGFLIPYVPSRPNMRSANRFLLVTPRTKRTVGDKAFAAVAPRLWNSLLIHIRNCSSTTLFKKALKTHLFPVS